MSEPIRPNGDVMFMTETAYWLMDASPAIYTEVELTGSIKTSIPFVPTDWSEEDPSIMGDYTDKHETCQDCFVLKSLSGDCDCTI